MNVLISGASGLVGRALTRALSALGHQVQGLSRKRISPNAPFWDIPRGLVDLGDFSNPDVVIHLAGESIAQGRWSAEKKARIYHSRVDSTRLLAQTLATLPAPPKTLLSCSAVGFYGSCGAVELDEDSPPGKGFLADVCRDWEEAATEARSAGIQVIHPRFGVILSPEGGALKEMLTPFRLGLGGPVGSGHQWLSWISLSDAVTALIHLMEQPLLEGPVNIVSPHPVPQGEFARILGRVLRRPAILPLPAFAARLLFGEKGDQLLLASTRALPERLQQSGFQYQHPRLEPALAALLKIT